MGEFAAPFAGAPWWLAAAAVAAALWWVWETLGPWRTDVPHGHTQRGRTLDVAYQTACAALGLKPQSTDVTKAPRGASILEQTEAARVAASQQREAVRQHRRQVLSRTSFDDDGLAQATVAFPAWVDTSPDGRPRTALERLWAERFPGRRWTFDWQPDRVVVAASEPLPDVVPFDTGSLGDRPWWQVPVGVGHDGEVVWNLRRAPHLLLGGKTGSGKTSVMRLWVVHALHHGAELVCLDPKRVEFTWLAGRPGVTVASTDERGTVAPMLRLLIDACDEMESRFRRLEEAGVTTVDDLDDGTYPPVFVLIDEARDLLDTKGAADRDAREQCAQRILSLAQKGRAAAVHLVVATQQPYANFVPGSLSGNLEARLALGNLNRHQSPIVLDSDDATRIDLDAPRGRGIARLGRYVDVQCWWLSRADAEASLPAATVEPDDAGQPVEVLDLAHNQVSGVGATPTPATNRPPPDGVRPSR